MTTEPKQRYSFTLHTIKNENELVPKLNNLSADGWEIFHISHTPPFQAFSPGVRLDAPPLPGTALSEKWSILVRKEVDHR